MCCKLRMYRVVFNPIIFIMVFVALTTTTQSSPWFCKGPLPSGNITTDRLIYSSGYKTGRNVDVECQCNNASDPDEMWTDIETFEYVYDGFVGGNAYTWVITNLASGESNPFNATGDDISFTTKNNTGSGTIALKLKDDGVYTQDYSTPTQVDHKAVEILDPDGIEVANQDDEVFAIGANAVYTMGDITWQLTYSGMSLPWRGSITEEITQGEGEHEFDDYHINQNFPLNTYPTLDFVEGATWNADDDIYEGITNDGQWIDTHSTIFDKPLPEAGKYHVWVILQRFKIAEEGGDYFGDTFLDHDYIDNNPEFYHHITPDE